MHIVSLARYKEPELIISAKLRDRIFLTFVGNYMLILHNELLKDYFEICYNLGVIQC